MTEKYEKIHKIALEITTGKKRTSGTDDEITLFIGGYKWILDNPKHDDFEKGRRGIYELDVPDGMDSSWFRFLCFQKKSRGRDDPWQIEKITLKVNDQLVYEKEGLKVWLKADAPRWCAPGFTYGRAGE
jgi:hypothetical protein